MPSVYSLIKQNSPPTGSGVALIFYIFNYQCSSFILTEVIRDFVQFLQINPGIVKLLDCDGFLPDPFHFIACHSS
jgi:hypothetical protein